MCFSLLEILWNHLVQTIVGSWHPWIKSFIRSSSLSHIPIGAAWPLRQELKATNRQSAHFAQRWLTHDLPRKNLELGISGCKENWQEKSAFVLHHAASIPAKNDNKKKNNSEKKQNIYYYLFSRGEGLVLAFQSYHCDQYKPPRDSILLQSWASPKIVYVRVLEKNVCPHWWVHPTDISFTNVAHLLVIKMGWKMHPQNKSRAYLSPFSSMNFPPRNFILH